MTKRIICQPDFEKKNSCSLVNKPRAKNKEHKDLLFANVNRLNALLFRSIGNLLPVLIGAGHGEHPPPIDAVPARKHVRRERLVCVANVRHA